ncbi:endoplasmic reticulum junction formation protein lunapark-B [Pholidichthys leucotaenia]
MGGVISQWKTKRTTVEQLETLDKEIRKLEEFRAKNQRQQKLWVGRLLLYSSVLYLFSSLIVYCLYLPEQWLQRLSMALPFFIYPILVWLIRKLLIFLFSKRTERNNDKLEDLKLAKKKILEDVMEKETYKNAKVILDRFDPEAKKKAELESTPVRSQVTPSRPGQEIRQRGVHVRPMGTLIPVPGARPVMGLGGTPVERVPLSAPGGPPDRSTLSTPVHQGGPFTTSSPVPGLGMHPPGPPLARPILPKDRGAVDRVIEYLVGDGPQNRYALICQQCFSHNGMALKEEFEYLAFRCAYCYFMNPARKTRPQAPRLPEFSFERRVRAESRSPGPTPRSGTDTEESAPPSGDEKEVGGDDQPRKEVESGSQSEKPIQWQEEEEEEVEQQQEEEEEGVEESKEELDQGPGEENPRVQSEGVPHPSFGTEDIG